MDIKESEEEFKLRLRPWLVKKIESHQYGLEWINEGQKLFKIPWTKKGDPNWEEDYKVFIVRLLLQCINVLIKRLLVVKSVLEIVIFVLLKRFSS